MIDFKQIIAESIAQITKIEVNEIKGFIEVPKEQGNGDYAFPCFKLAKTLRKSPNVIADDIKANVNISEKYVEKIDMFASTFFHKEITKHAENKKILSEEAWNSSKIFYRQYMSDPKTKLYVEMDDFVPDFETASNLVREAGGLVFIPHIYEYKKNSEPILEHILKNYKIDGIECYYTTFTEEQHKRLLNLCKERNLFVSGGSDFHGTIKPDVDIGVGYGNMQIPDEILNSWKNKIKFFK